MPIFRQYGDGSPRTLRISGMYRRLFRTFRPAAFSAMAVLFLFHNRNAMAQTDSGNSIRTNVTDSLTEATVTAGRLIQAAAPSDSISGERLELSVNVADAIRVFGGIQLKDYGGVGGLKTVNVRSMGSEHTAVFIDGIQIGNAQNAQVDLGRFSTEDLESISLYTGLSGDALRSAKEYSSGASVYLRTSRPDFSDGRNFHARIRVRGGSFGTISPYIRWEQRLGKDISATAGLEYIGASGRYRFRCRKEAMTPDGKLTGYDTTMVRNNSDISAVRAELNVFGKVSGGEWTVKAYMYDSERGLPGAVVRKPELLSAVSDRQRDRNILVQGQFRKDLTANYTLQIKGKYANDFMRYRNDPRTDPSAMPADDSYLQHGAWLSFSNLIRLFPWWRLTVAADAQFNALDSDKTGFVRPRRVTFWGAAGTEFNLNRLTITAGAVYSLAADFRESSRSGKTEGPSFSGTGDPGKAVPGKTTDFRNTVSPAVTFRYIPFDSRWMTVGGFVRRSYRMPTFNDLYYVNFGNVSLRPEDAMQYDLRLDFRVRPSGKWTLAAKAEGYYNNIRDKIIAVPTSSQFRWTMYNIGHTHIAGAEGTFGWEYSPSCIRVSAGQTRKPAGENRDTSRKVRRSGAGKGTDASGTDRLKVGMTIRYTFQRAMDVSKPGSSTYGGQIPYIPRHSGSVTASAGWKGWSADYSFVYTGTRYTSSSNIRSTVMYPWSTHDVTISRAFGFGVTLRLSVNNILNRQYEIVPNYPMPRCNFLLSAEYRF